MKSDSPNGTLNIELTVYAPYLRLFMSEPTYVHNVTWEVDDYLHHKLSFVTIRHMGDQFVGRQTVPCLPLRRMGKVHKHCCFSYWSFFNIWLIQCYVL